MSKKTVIITRIDLGDCFEDEWSEYWMLDANAKIQYIGEDIILIHGSIVEYSEIYSIISNLKLDYSQTFIYIHPGGGGTTQDLVVSFKNEGVNDKVFFNTVKCYSLGSDYDKREEIRIITRELQNPKTYENAKEKLLVLIGPERTTTEQLSLRKHQIAHLFLPIDMDLQGIREVMIRENNNENVQTGKGSVDYLKEVIDNKDKEYFQTLIDLQFMVAGNKLYTVEERSNLQIDLTKKESILDLIEDKKDTIKDKWDELLMLCGLNEEQGFINLNKNSIICRFMEMMDSIVKKRNEIQDNTQVVNILEFFKPEFKSFHDWFCKLDECLDKIREALKE
jgi:hypothetical protein